MQTQHPWILKYMPKKLEDIILPEHIYSIFNEYYQKKDIPNILLVGSYGIGKSLTISCLCRGILNNLQENLLEINASDERGIKFVQDTINTFCKKINLDDKKKIIIFDEADNITEKAQKLINSYIDEKYKNTSFIFICNMSTNIIDSIQSKCVIVRLSNYPKEKIYDRIKWICTQENIKCDDDFLKFICAQCKYDIRAIINQFEYYTTICKIDNLEKQKKEKLDKEKTYTETIDETVDEEKINKKKIDEEKITETKQEYELSLEILKYDMFFNKQLIDIIKLCLHCKINAIQKINELCKSGISNGDILQSLGNILKYSQEFKLHIPTDKKINYLKIINETLFHTNNGFDTNLQLTGCIAKILRC